MKHDFIKGVESLVNPITVGSLHFIQSLNRFLPKTIQKLLVKSSGKKIPYMGFIVEPYSFFLCYEIDDIDKANSLLPDNFKLIKTHIFKNDEPKYYGIIGCFRSHTSAFWGTRAECYIIAEDQKTRLLSWIIVDYDSDTISYDNQNGLKDPNAKAIHATDYDGDLYVDIKQNTGDRRLSFVANLNNAQTKQLDQRLWLEGNLSIGYGRVISDNKADIFSLKFKPEEVANALDIPIGNFKLEENSWYPGLFKTVPQNLVCFPYAQHFISDSPGSSSKLMNKDDLIKSINNLDFNSINVLSTKSFAKLIIINSIVSTVIILTLILLLIFKK